MFRHVFLFLSFILFFNHVLAQASTTCSAAVACYQGCCSADGNCGFGPDFCGDGCQGNCDAKAECGKYAETANFDCPINVCCSQFGYCGTTEDFCGTGCQNNTAGGGCGIPSDPETCDENTDAMTYDRRIGYYELFNLAERLCDQVYPEDLLVSPLTHINLAFVNFGDDFKIIDDSGDIISRVAFLKARNSGLRVNIAVGGWAFNDPPTSTYFSDMTSTYTNRETFINSVIDFLNKYGLDGIDIDWEYPAATDRGGNSADTDNYVLLVSQMREAFDQAGQPGWEITITIPTSYWYLRGFDLSGLQKYISWFNLMSYDLHGMWDQHNKFTGPYLEGHTNITEIENGLSLLWRNDVKPENVVFGLAFYGRSFTMSDASCYKPGCTFSTSGLPGSCTNTGGILSYSEIVSRNSSLDVSTYYDEASTVKYNVFEGSQWISYDDEQSFTDKKRFISSHCLSGVMIWAIDQDTADHAALAGLLGDFSNTQLQGGSLDDRTATALSTAFSAYTGQDCFVTPTCTDGTDKQKQNDQVCPSGTMSVSTAHSPKQAAGKDLNGDCSEGWFRYICCPTKSMPKNCAWNGAPERSEFGCSGSCGSDQFSLNTDDYVDALGKGNCYTGTRDLCCDATEVLTDCFWTGCQGPLAIDTVASCGSDDYEFQTHRYDQDNGDWCSAAYVSPVDGAVGSPLHDRFKRAFCCPKGHGYSNCNWSNQPLPDPKTSIIPYDPEAYCTPQQCSSKQTQVTKALDPPPNEVAVESHVSCDGVSVSPGYDPEFSYCCDPPSTYSNKWPVDPKDLFEDYYDADDSDVMWAYDDEYNNNNADSSQSASDTDDGSDAYGFVMLDGAPGSLDNDFPATNTIARRTVDIPNRKHMIMTTDHSIINATFEHSEETVYVYCNYPQDSPECQKVWFKGAEDTIIRLPTHVGEGPYARIVSMELAEPEYELPDHHIHSRSLESLDSPVYKLKFDYDFHLIKRDDVVNMRVDFTNLLGYWDEVTDTAADSKKKREMYSEHLSQEAWHGKIKTAKRKHDKLRKRKVVTSDGLTTTEMINHEGNKNLAKRWWGAFTAWLDRLNTVESKELGYLSMAFQRSLLLFKASIGCPGKTYFASLKMFFDANVEMEATYAYYFSGTIVPPAVTGTYAYFGLEPSAYLGLRMTGNAQLQTPPGKYRKKILDTISYPGLSLKGIAAVGPTLDLWGEIRGKITLKGEMLAGATLNFDKAEVFWPQDDASSEKYQSLVGIDAKPSHPATDLVTPSFDAKVRMDASMSIIVTPEANMGIQIGGPLSSGTLVNAQVVGFINSSLSFEASVVGTAGSTSDPTLTYSYGVYLIYNLGYGAVASVKGFASWAAQNRYAYSPSPRFKIFEQTGSFISTTADKRSIDSPKEDEHYVPRRGLLDWPRLKLSPLNSPSKADSYASPSSSNSSLDIESLLGKRADTDTSMTDAPDFTQNDGVTCPAGDTAEITLPDYRLNCLIFQDSQLQNPNTGATSIVSGICPPVQDWYTRNSFANSGVTLTWDPNSDRTNDRRGETCDTAHSCNPPQTALRTRIGDNTIAISCDEFPFAGAEEGGNFYTNQGNAASATCVPAWQNTLQGNCNKILSQLQTNVNYFERDARVAAGTDNGADNWVVWSSGRADNTWVTIGNPFNGQTIPPQRLSEYPTTQPHAAVPDADWNVNNQLSFVYKRNFTFGLATPSSADDGAAWATSGTGAAESWTFASTGQFPPGTDGNDLTTIACAVNTFHQDEIYAYNYNGLCYNGNAIGGRGFGTIPSFTSCDIEFATAASTKRSIGEFNGWKITGIKMRPDLNVTVEMPEDYVPEGPMIPVSKP